MSAPHTFIIAEAGVNHNGDVKLAHQLIDAAAAAGADAVKFQTFRTEKILSTSAPLAEYQQQNIGGGISQFEMIKQLELTYGDFRLLQQHCREIGILFLSTPDEEESLDFLADELDLPWLKIGSAEVTNLPYLRRIALKGKSIILSTGMSTLGEVERALQVLREHFTGEIILLHCTTNYPCPAEEVNLQAMCTLQRAFGLKVGYSDHSEGLEASIAAVALGAVVIEKHFTLDKTMTGPDHRASLDPQELRRMVQSIRFIEQALGDGIKRPNASEQSILTVVRKRLVASQPLPAGHQLTAEDFAYKRADTGIFCEHMELVLGRILLSPVVTDQAFEWRHFFPDHYEVRP